MAESTAMLSYADVRMCASPPLSSSPDPFRGLAQSTSALSEVLGAFVLTWLASNRCAVAETS